MIATNPSFIKGDRLSLKQYFAALFINRYLLYRNRLIWFKKTTLFWCLPLLLLDIIFFVVLLYKGWSLWYLFFPFMVGLPLIWMRSYYKSFTLSSKITNSILTFIDHYIPGSSNIRRLIYSNYLFCWNGLEFEAACSFVPALNSKGKVVKRYKSYIVCLHFMPDLTDQSGIIDKNGKLLDGFYEQWNAYCEGKESCKYLRVENYTIYFFVRECDLKDSSQIITTMEQVKYLIKRFNLIPLYISGVMEAQIKSWLLINNQKAPEDIIALNISVNRRDDGYTLCLSGSKTYDPNNSWVCNNDFVPKEKYLDITMETITESDWREFQNLVKDILTKKVPSMAENESSLFHNRVVTMDFGDGNLIKISDKN